MKTEGGEETPKGIREMSDNLLEQLAGHEVPPIPEEFDEQLHGRVSRNLLIHDLVDLGLRATPWAMGIFAQSVVDLFGFTLSGRLQNEHRRRRR